MLAFILNIPWTLEGCIIALLSFPKKIEFKTKPHYHILIYTPKFWWAVWKYKGTRAFCSGHVVVLSPQILEKDYEHELIHVRQHIKYPFIFPFLYNLELIRHGYRNN